MHTYPHGTTLAVPKPLSHVGPPLPLTNLKAAWPLWTCLEEEKSNGGFFVATSSISRRLSATGDFLAASLGSRVNFTLLLSEGFNTTYSLPHFGETERKKEWKAWIFIRTISRGEEPLWNFKFLKSRLHVKWDLWIFHNRSWGDLQYFMITSTASKLVARNKCYTVTFYYYNIWYDFVMFTLYIS